MGTQFKSLRIFSTKYEHRFWRKTSSEYDIRLYMGYIFNEYEKGASIANL